MKTINLKNYDININQVMLMIDNKECVLIPTIGSIIELRNDWEFELYGEHRNKKLFEYFKLNYQDYSYKYVNREYIDMTCAIVTLPAFTKLKVDRIYIRKNISGYDSVSFYLLKPNEKVKMTSVRFWAKLKDVNHIEGVWDSDTIPY